MQLWMHCMICRGFMRIVRVHGTEEGTTNHRQGNKVLFRLLTLQIAPIHLLPLNSFPWAHSMTCQAKGKSITLLSGRCPHYIVQCSVEGEVKAMYRCDLRHTQMLHASTVMLINQVKLQYQGLGESAKLLQREHQA